jgi:CBS domain-containing protein
MTIAAIIGGAAHNIFTASQSESVGEVVARLAENRIGALPVVDGSSVVGIFSERDIVYGVAKHGSAFLSKTVGEVMTAPAITVTVVDDGALTGFVSIGDLVKHRIEKIESEAAAMRHYIQMA